MAIRVLKSDHFDSSIGMEGTYIFVKIFHFSTDIFIMIQATRHKNEKSTNEKPRTSTSAVCAGIAS